MALRVLDLSHQCHLCPPGSVRKFTGGVPSRITLVNKLTGLYLQNNSFSGALPQQIWRMASLEYLHANDNQVPEYLTLTLTLTLSLTPTLTVTPTLALALALTLTLTPTL